MPPSTAEDGPYVWNSGSYRRGREGSSGFFSHLRNELLGGSAQVLEPSVSTVDVSKRLDWKWSPGMYPGTTLLDTNNQSNNLPVFDISTFQFRMILGEKYFLLENFVLCTIKNNLHLSIITD